MTLGRRQNEGFRAAKVWFVAAICVVLSLVGVSQSSARIATKTITSFSPADGATVFDPLPTFTIATSGFDATKASDNPFVVVSPSFQVDTNGEISLLSGALPCTMQALPGGPTASVYTAREDPAASPVSLSICQLRPGATYYWQIQFAADPQTVAPGVITCTNGVYCHTKVMTLTLAQAATTTSASTATPSPTVVVDRSAPKVKAFPATLRARVSGRLAFRASDNSGVVAVAMVIYAGKTQAKVWSKILPRVSVETGITYGATWKPRKAGRYAFCLLAQDAAGNKSATSCATVTVR